MIQATARPNNPMTKCSRQCQHRHRPCKPQGEPGHRCQQGGSETGNGRQTQFQDASGQFRAGQHSPIIAMVGPEFIRDCVAQLNGR